MVFITRAAIALACTVAVSWAQQSTGTTTGAVRDSTGASIVGVNLKLISTATGVQRTGLSDEAGTFVFSGMSPGEYRLTDQVSG